MTISTEGKEAIANAVYRDARQWGDRLHQNPDSAALETIHDVCHGLCCALMEMGLDTGEIQWIHDSINNIATRAGVLRQEVR